MDISKVLENGIGNIGATLLKHTFKHAGEKQFIDGFLRSIRTAAARRAGHKKAGVHIPPFLIASIAQECNLSCSGCYARENGVCGSPANAPPLTAAEWAEIFRQGVDAGVLFTLLAGGEPLLRRDVIETAARFPDMVFPVFTNGTMLDSGYIDFLDAHRHIIPIFSIEGGENETDARRGKGVAALVDEKMLALRDRGILYGCSITVTKANAQAVAAPAFVRGLNAKGCGIVFYVEYVPVESGSEALAPDDATRTYLDTQIKQLKKANKTMLFISFPGDEKYLGGCLAAGRGFFHINPSGGAEPCPFSPYSDTSLKDTTLVGALSSPLFMRVRADRLLSGAHSGGCALFEHEEIVKSFIDPS